MGKCTGYSKCRFRQGRELFVDIKNQKSKTHKIVIFQVLLYVFVGLIYFYLVGKWTGYSKCSFRPARKLFVDIKIKNTKSFCSFTPGTFLVFSPARDQEGASQGSTRCQEAEFGGAQGYEDLPFYPFTSGTFLIFSPARDRQGASQGSTRCQEALEFGGAQG